MRYTTTLALVLSLGCGASAPGAPPADGGADVASDGVAAVADAGMTCPEGAAFCGRMEDSVVEPGGGGGTLGSYWLNIAARLRANDAVTMCPLPSPCMVCPNGHRIWTVATLENLTRAYIAAGNRCP